MNKYYAVLGLPSTSSKDEVRRAYRKMVLIWHPDKNPSPEAHGKFIQITEAYDILMGERSVPRSTAFTTKRRTAAPAPPPKKKTTIELYREKFINERNRIRKDPHFAANKTAAEKKYKVWRVVAASMIIFVIVPWFIPPFNVITCSVISLFAMQFAMRIVLHSHNLERQAAMMYGERENYDYTEIRDYFLPEHKLRWSGSPWAK